MSEVDLSEQIKSFKKNLYEGSYYEFLIKSFEVLHQGQPLIDNWHIKEICWVLQCRVEKMLRGESGKHIIINVPPRSLKSIITSVCLLPWIWTIDPSIKLISSSFNFSLSTDHSVMSRRLVESDWYQDLWGHRVIMAIDSNQKTYYENDKTGSRRATSTGGNITGKGADIIVIDDPVDPTKALSEVERTKANAYFDQTLSTRLNDPALGFFVVDMQRLHDNDLTAHILEKDSANWDRVCIPAELSDDVEPKELKSKYEDGLFFPERFTKKVLANYLTALGSYGYAGQMQQTPSPQGGGIWKKWFIVVEDKDFPSPVQLRSYGTDWDLAYTEKDENSASAYVAAGKIDGNMYIDKLGFVRHEFPNLIKFMAAMPSPHYIEAKASGKSAKQTLQSMGISAIEVNDLGGDKIARANVVTPYAEGGLCYIRKSLVDLLYYDSAQGILKFPNAKNDDLADALSQSMKRLFKKRQIWAA